ncbi:MAG: phenylacetate-CoA oxygenase/reductase subunit PaaK [Pseudomonadota bacterium]|jgi:ring-1,2-phenylacetyl-CoA epoxidase subunit PaaE
MSLHFHPLRVRAVQPDSDEAMLVSFDVPADLADTFRFQPGQYLTLRGEIGGQDLRRSYSICAAPEDGELRVGVRRVPGGVFSGWVNDTLRAGDTLQVFPPQGHFTLPARAEGAGGRHVVGIAGGSGITPILSIMKTVLAQEPDSRFTLVYGNRSTRSTMFKEEIEDLKNRHLTRLALHHVFSEEPIDTPLNAGRLDADKLALFLRTLVPAGRIDEAFVCGPHGFNDEVEAGLRAAGVPAARIHVERFGVPDAARASVAAHPALPGDAPQARVSILRDGLTREIDFRTGDPSILDAAARAGLEVPYSCKSGVCCTCRARVLEGQVRMDRNFALEPHEVAAGFVLTCQSHPLTPRVVLSFDDR